MTIQTNAIPSPTELSISTICSWIMLFQIATFATSSTSSLSSRCGGDLKETSVFRGERLNRLRREREQQQTAIQIGKTTNTSRSIGAFNDRSGGVKDSPSLQSSRCSIPSTTQTTSIHWLHQDCSISMDS